MNPETLEIIARVLSDEAEGQASPQQYFQELVARTTLTPPFRAQLANFGAGHPRAVALQLVRWAGGKGINPAEPEYTTLGSILRVILDDLGLETQSTVVSVIIANDLYRDHAVVSALRARYQVPLGQQPGLPDDRSPDIDWKGPEDTLTLQGFRKQPSPFLDVGFLARAIDRSRSVCRVERPEGCPLGTGFLVGPDLVITNFHVLAPNSGDDPSEDISRVTFRFGCVTSAPGDESRGQTFHPEGPRPVVASSPIDELDYILVRAEGRIRTAVDLGPLAYSEATVIAKGMALNILQHPKGGAMQLALSSNGVTGVYDDIRRVQYVTETAGGSSGSPCFDEGWRLAALHHAEQARNFGTVRQGIPFAAIHDGIRAYL
jgi:V8-like Glu-specific endopeptidase